MTNKDKAIALINTFATGDTEAAGNLLAEGYIQHNLAYGTGREAFVGSVARERILTANGWLFPWFILR